MNGEGVRHRECGAAIHNLTAAASNPKHLARRIHRFHVMGRGDISTPDRRSKIEQRGVGPRELSPGTESKGGTGTPTDNPASGRAERVIL